MILYKTKEEIELIRKSSELVSKTHAALVSNLKPGVKTIELDRIAESFIRDHGAIPAFLNYNGFPNTLCISVNEQVVHGIPGKYELKEGDLLSIDCGVLWNGFYGDSAYTYAIGEIKPEVRSLMRVTKESLYKGIEMAVKGNRIGDISFAVQQHAESHGYSVVRELIGHGVGRSLHESPEVPNYGKRGKGPLIQDGLVIAIEPMINLGRKEIMQLKDGWTIVTRDGKPSAHYEHTIAIVDGKAEILSNFEIIEQLLDNK
jgi:methionyl aminopeptidase